jgi:hypothetical protein
VFGALTNQMRNTMWAYNKVVVQRVWRMELNNQNKSTFSAKTIGLFLSKKVGENWRKINKFQGPYGPFLSP